MIDAGRLREVFRDETSPSLRRRRAIAWLASLGLADFAVITLYQLGALHHLPDLPGAVFDSDRVNASESAYARGVPDGATGAALYALTLVLAGAGGTRDTGRWLAFDVGLAAAAAAGLGGALVYLRDMVEVQRRACPYCLVGAALNVGLAGLAGAELGSALRRR